MWRSAAEPGRPPHAWESRYRCVGCPIGAENAGVSPAAAAVAAAAAEWSPICPRCGASGRRMIRDALCISCYNRQAEAERGRNAKGSKPRICAVLHRTRLAIDHGAGARSVRTDLLIEPAEALIRAAKRATGPVYFGLAPPPLGALQPQGTLGLELLLPPGTPLRRRGRAKLRHTVPVPPAPAQSALAL